MPVPTLPVFLSLDDHTIIPAELEGLSSDGMVFRTASAFPLPTTMALRMATRVGVCEAVAEMLGMETARGISVLRFLDMNAALEQLVADMARLRPKERIEFLGAVLDPRLQIQTISARHSAA